VSNMTVIQAPLTSTRLLMSPIIREPGCPSIVSTPNCSCVEPYCPLPFPLRRPRVVLAPASFPLIVRARSVFRPYCCVVVMIHVSGLDRL
jgi:hypothetical protein